MGEKTSLPSALQLSITLASNKGALCHLEFTFCSFFYPVNIMSYLIHLIPVGVEGPFDHITFEGLTSDADFNIGVTLSLHKPHHFVLSNHILSPHQMDPQHPLVENIIKCRTLTELTDLLQPAICDHNKM